MEQQERPEALIALYERDAADASTDTDTDADGDSELMEEQEDHYEPDIDASGGNANGDERYSYMLPTLTLGLDTPIIPNMYDFMSDFLDFGKFTSVVTSLSCGHPRNSNTSTKSELLLPSYVWNRSVIARISTPLADLTSPVGSIRQVALTSFAKEVEWAVHLSIPILVLPPLPQDPLLLSYYAIAVNRAIELAPTIQLWQPFHIINIDASTKRYDVEDLEKDFETSEGSLEVVDISNEMDSVSSENASQAKEFAAWFSLLQLCSYSSSLGLYIQLPVDLQISTSLTMTIERLIGEPVRSISLPVNAFSMTPSSAVIVSTGNKRDLLSLGLSLPTATKYVLRKLVVLQCLVFLRHDSLFSNLSLVTPEETFSVVQALSCMMHYVYYLTTFFASFYVPITPLELPYLDVLECPLQPLADNLTSNVYEVFEDDTTKYVIYQEAIEKALLHKKLAKGDHHPLSIAVVGAGRGPLVSAVLNAAAKVDVRSFMVSAIEKNHFAVQILEAVLAENTSWHNHVRIIEADMRKQDQWKSSINKNDNGNDTQQFDIVISELLGSFGDNEASVECLKEIEFRLFPDAICIPSSSTSFLSPISSIKLYSNVSLLNNSSIKGFETPYVVRAHNFYALSSPQHCFTFVHGTHHHKVEEWKMIQHQLQTQKAHLSPMKVSGDEYIEMESTQRHCALQFECLKGGTLTGLLGYFTAHLYDDVYISILPSIHSPGMYSWFPIYFPLHVPLRIQDGERIEVHMRRQSDEKRVWYEWFVQTSSGFSPVLNSNGRSSFIGL